MLDRASFSLETAAAEPRAEPPGAAVPTLIEAAGLTLETRAARLLGPIDLALDAAASTVVMGPNGAGKSLLLRLLHGLISPSGGAVRWRGAPLSAEARRAQAMVFQRPVLLRRSAAANIDFALRLRGRADPARREALLESVGLAAKARQPARLLSGGEQQRLALARALATSPQALFLDEPTASLDPASTQLIEREVRAAKARGVKIVFVTHDIGQARRMGDEVVFLHRGQVAERAEAAPFFTDPRSEAAQRFLDGEIVL